MRRINRYIIIVLATILLVYLVFLDDLAKPIFESQATEMYGAEVTIDRVRLKPFRGEATLYDLQVADRRDADRNLVQAERVFVELDIIKLAGNVIDVSNMEVDGLVSFAPRAFPATILRPLVAADSGIAKLGLPDFTVPDVDRLADQQRDALVAELDDIEQSFTERQKKWKDKLDEVPDEADIKAYKARIKALKDVKDPLQALTAVQEAQKVYADINRQIEAAKAMQQAFRGDLQLMREQIEATTRLPRKYTRLLVESLGLSSEQVAQLGRQLLRGDLDGLLQQILAPLAFDVSGEASAPANAMPVFIRRATINGSLLPSAAGLSVSGELKDFAWPLHSADSVALLLLKGSSVGGGRLTVNANVDHRGEPDDSVTVDVSELPLRDMALAGTSELGIRLLQALVDVSGELRVRGGELDGAFTNRFSSAMFETRLAENAGRAARLIARVLQSTENYMMRIGFGGTLENPRVNFASDMDAIFQNTLQSALQDTVNTLTAELQQRLTREIGPKIAAARQQFSALENLQAELQRNLNDLTALSARR